ncbi:MAG: HAMP domain-containing protein [Saprospiraceae bacterium]|nr:HAMP domain-containing protein [Saprospiraceae bacterium]
MKLSAKFILFIVVIHAVTITLSFFIFKENKLLFLVAEFFILLSLAISWSLYNELIRPLQLLLRGADAIKDRDFNVRFVKTGKFEMDQLIEVYNHMIDQLRLERTTQQEQHYFLEKLIQTSPTGIILFDYDGFIAAMNPRALEWTALQREKAKRRPLSDFTHPVFQVIGELKTGESKTITLDGPRTLKIQKAQFVDRGFPCDFVMIEELTVEILEAEKRSYGKVIRMMAHEVNNSIGAVNSILDTTLQLQAPDSEVKPALQVAIERNEHLSHFMRNFADVIRLPAPTKALVDLNELLRKVTQLMSFSAKNAGVNLELSIPHPSLQAWADAGQIEQVLVNMIKNAIEASPKNGTVSITLTSNPRQLTIANNGKPIPKEVEDKLFTPFFSTKNGGQGIGLTLAREILTAHGWPFSLKSDPDGWTRFAVKP